MSIMSSNASTVSTHCIYTMYNTKNKYWNFSTISHTSNDTIGAKVNASKTKPASFSLHPIGLVDIMLEEKIIEYNTICKDFIKEIE